MATLSERKAVKAVKKFNVELLKILPLENKLFCAMLFQDDLLPLGSGDIVKEYQTRHEKVSFFLDNIIKPAPEKRLPKLLEIMNNCDDEAVKNLAAKITDYTGIADQNDHRSESTNIDHDDRQMKSKVAKKYPEEFMSYPMLSITDIDSNSVIDLSFRSIDFKLHAVNQDFQLMRNHIISLLRKLRQTEEHCETQTLELHQQSTEIEYWKDKSYRLKAENQELKSIVSESKINNLRAKIQQQKCKRFLNFKHRNRNVKLTRNTRRKPSCNSGKS